MLLQIICKRMHWYFVIGCAACIFWLIAGIIGLIFLKEDNLEIWGWLLIFAMLAIWFWPIHTVCSIPLLIEILEDIIDYYKFNKEMRKKITKK